MIRITFRAAATSMFALLSLPLMSLPAWAADLALVVVNSEYSSLGDLDGDRYAARYQSELEDAGFDVFSLQDGSAKDMRKVVRDFVAASGADDDNRIVIVLTGHMAHSGSETYLLGVDANRPDGFSVAGMGQAVSPLLALAGTAQGRAVILMARTDENSLDVGPALTAGSGPITAPQGVTLIEGDPRPLLFALRDGILPEENSYAAAADRAPRGVRYDGFVSSAIGLTTPTTAKQARSPRPDPERPDPGEFAYWNAAQDIGSEESLRAYLNRYPNGTFAADARARLDSLREAPVRAAKDREAALSLSREARREVQRYLTLIGFNTRGVDGIFGPATRKALTDWQAARRFKADGYLDSRQLTALRSEGEARAAELEREAEKRRAAQEQEDRDHWARTGSNGDKAGLRAYLERYPDGLFADTAKQRLARIAEREQERATTEARRAWNRAKEADTEEAYVRYLRAYPDSPFEDAARSRITELRQPPRDEAAERAAQQEENDVAGAQITRLLIERRLQQLGMDPGTPDGQFDGETRRALRRFQQSRGIQPTGYVNQATIVRLLAG